MFNSGGYDERGPEGSDRTEDLRAQIMLWVGDRRLVAAMRAEELAQLEGLERVVALRNGLVATAISYVRGNPRADSTLAVLILIAFLCDNNNGLCRVGAKRMGEIFGRAERNIRDTMHRLEEMGLIGLVRPGGTGELASWIKVPTGIPRTKVNTMAFVAELAAEPAPAGRPNMQSKVEKITGCGGAKSPDVERQSPDVEAQSATENHRMQSDISRAGSDIYNNINNITPVGGEDRGSGGKEPSAAPSPLVEVERIQPAGGVTGKPKAKHAMPPGWTPGRAGGEYALSLGLTAAEATDEWHRFRAHHEAQGSKFSNWFAAWQLWCRNAVKFGRERQQSREGPSMRDLAREAARTMKPDGRR
jgi:hypothetical protein